MTTTNKNKKKRVVVSPQEGSQADFLNAREKIVFYGGAAGSGKSHALIMDALQYINDPNFYAIYFRQNTTQLEGSLWPLAKSIYSQFGAVFREKQKTCTFPSGAKIKFSYMELDKHADPAHQGIEYSAIYWDEFTHFNEFMFNYLRSRMRSQSDNPSFMKASMNPDRDHFVYEWIKHYLYEEDQLDENGECEDDMRKGCPDRSLCGLTRYFVIIGNDLHTAWDKQKLIDKFPKNKPKSYTFISGTIDDNPILDEIEPDYRENLESLPHVNKQRLRYGNWDVRPEGSGYFERGWCEIVNRIPASAVRVRSWDTAATLPSDITPNPDWTAGVRMSKDKNGIYYIEHVERFRDRPAGVEAKIKDVAKDLDGDDILVTIPMDPAAAGKAQATQIIRMLAENGITCRSKPTNKNKVTRFSPFSAAAEAGLIKIVQGSWNNAYFSELESFTGDGKLKDDQVDATSDAFITLADKKHVPVFRLPNMSRSNPFNS